MYDPTFHEKTLKTEINHADHLKDKNLFKPEYQQGVVKAAVQRSKIGYHGASLTSRIVNRSPVYAFEALSDELVLRKVSKNFRRANLSRRTSRTLIIKCLKCLGSEGVAFRVYKVDIRRFYESIDKAAFVSALGRDVEFPPSTVNVLSSFFNEIERAGIKGVPRGLSVSAAIAEYVMKDFDLIFKKLEQVFFYARFVDDMIFVTKSDEPPSRFLRIINRNLPIGLQINAAKTKYYDFVAHQKSHQPVVENDFNFLGYQFNVGYAIRIGRQIHRSVVLDISPKKVQRIKTRLCIAMQRFVRDHRFDDLVDRIRMLSANYTFYDIKSGNRRKAGIYHSYHLIHAEDSTALKQLDKFYRGILLSNSGRLCSKLQQCLSQAARTELLKYSFERGFREKLYFLIDARRIAYLRKCWTNA